MALNISNVGDSWSVKLFRETWFFHSMSEFDSVFKFFLDKHISFSVSIAGSGFSVCMNDVNLPSVSYNDLDKVLDSVLDFKFRFGDRSRVGLVSFPKCVNYSRPKFIDSENGEF